MRIRRGHEQFVAIGITDVEKQGCVRKSQVHTGAERIPFILPQVEGLVGMGITSAKVAQENLSRADQQHRVAQLKSATGQARPGVGQSAAALHHHLAGSRGFRGLTEVDRGDRQCPAAPGNRRFLAQGGEFGGRLPDPQRLFRGVKGKNNALQG